MRFDFYIVFGAFAALAVAQNGENPFNNPPGGYSFSAGSATELSWKPTTQGDVTLKLQWGSNITPENGDVIAANIPNTGSYSWTPSASLPDRTDYTIEIISDTNNEYNFLPPFQIAGLSDTTSSSIPATQTTSSAVSAMTSTSTNAISTTTIASSISSTMVTSTTVKSTMASSTTASGTTASSTAVTSASTSAIFSSSVISSSSAISTMATRTSSGTGTSASTTSSMPPGSSIPVTSIPNINGGVVNHAPGGMLALVICIIAAM